MLKMPSIKICNVKDEICAFYKCKFKDYKSAQELNLKISIPRRTIMLFVKPLSCFKIKCFDFL